MKKDLLTVKELAAVVVQMVGQEIFLNGPAFELLFSERDYNSSFGENIEKCFIDLGQ